MKIAFVVHDFLPGVGHGRYCTELAWRLARNHEVHVIANRFDAARFEEARVPIHTHHVPALRWTALTSVLTFPSAAQKIIDRGDFDIVHAQGYACERANVITAHICNAARYRRSPPRILTKRLFPAFVIPRERAFFQRAHGSQIIAVSNALKHELNEEYGIANAHTIYHGVDCDKFTPATDAEKLTARERYRIPNDRWVWLFAGEAVKGLCEALQALVEFKDAFLVVATRSDVTEYISLAGQLNIKERVTFAGPVEDMRVAYHAADIFVYPSAYDTFAMVVAEAMACGLPVVIGKTIGAAEWIQPGENGFLCDPNALAEELRIMRSVSGDQFRRVRTTARATAERHTWDACTERTLFVFQRVTSCG